MRAKLVIGSRGSKLALLQAEAVAAKIREKNPGLEVSISKILTQGDLNTRTRLDRMPGIGVFVKELEEALLDCRIDLAVHSLKDMPTDIPQGLSLVAIAEREDPRDVLVTKTGVGLAELAPGAKIGTGSLRRAVQVSRYRPDLEVCSIRGNVDTRLGKVASGEFDGVILAAAAMIRLGSADRINQYLPLEHFLPAAGQGALAVEARIDDEVTELLAFLNHLPTRQSVTAERAFLKGLGGGCRAAIAAMGTVDGATLKLEGMVADAESKKILSARGEGSTTTAEEIGARLAEKMLAMGASEFVTELRPE